METSQGIFSTAGLEAPRLSSAIDTYTRLMMSSTRLYPHRKPYVTHRMINEVEGDRMRKEWSGMDSSMKQHMQIKAKSAKEASWALRKQNLDLHCGSIYS